MEVFKRLHSPITKAIITCGTLCFVGASVAAPNKHAGMHTRHATHAPLVHPFVGNLESAVRRTERIPETDLPVSDAEAILKRMLHAEENVRLSGTQVTTILHHGQQVSSEQVVIRNGAKAMQILYNSPSEVSGMEIVDNGRFYFRYDPLKNTLEAGPSRIGRLRGRIRQVINSIEKHGLLVTSTGNDSVAGRTCKRIDVRPRGSTASIVRRFWVDDETGVQLGIEQYDARGRKDSSTFFTQIDLSSALPRDAFAPPKTPANVIVQSPTVGTPVPTIAAAQQMVDFALKIPAYVPPGFRFQSAGVSSFERRHLAVLRYVNGINVLSVFETPAPKQHGNEHCRQPRKGVLVGWKSDLRIILVGNLDKDELQRVIDSL